MNRRYYQIGGITIQVDSDIPFQERTFDPKFDLFYRTDPGKDAVVLHHHFILPDLKGVDTGEVVYQKPPWIIHRNDEGYIYFMVASGNTEPHMISFFNHDHTSGHIYSKSARAFREGQLHSLTMYPTDQILLVPLLADRRGFIMHAAGMVIDGHGILFVGHSEAGKSTTVTMLREMGEILCDDRIIVRKQPDGFHIYGTWSHGTVSEISPGFAPLRAIMLLEKSSENLIIPMDNRNEVTRLFPRYIIKTIISPDWWLKTLDTLDQLVREVPVYRLRLDKSGKVRDVIRTFLDSP